MIKFFVKLLYTKVCGFQRQSLWALVATYKKQTIKIDRGNKSFRFWRTGVRICTQLCRWKPNQVLSAFEFQRQIRKISHWEVFLDGASRQFPEEVFLLQKPPICQFKTWIDKFTPKCTWTIRFRTLRSAPRALPFGNPQFFEKIE